LRIIWSGVYATVWLVWWSAYTNYIIRSTLVVIITCFCFDCRSYSFIESATTNISRGVFGAISGKVSDDPPPCCISVFLLYYSVLLFLNYNSFSVVRFYFAELNVPQFCYFKTRFWNRLSYIGIQCNLLSGSAAFWGTCWLWWAYFYVISTTENYPHLLARIVFQIPNHKVSYVGSYYVICKSASMFFFQFEESSCLVFWYQQYLRDVNQVMQHYFAGYLGFNFLHLCFVFSSLFPEKDY
jgi:hypothetical protein